MEEEPRQNKPSGIARPSKIPVQVSKLPIARSSSLRVSSSRESLGAITGTGSATGTGTDTLRDSKLRSTPSRDQLAPIPSASNRPQPSTAPLRAVSSPQNRLSGQFSAGSTRTARSGPNAAAQPPRLARGGSQPPQGVRSSSATCGPLRRQSSQPWLSAAGVPQEEPIPEDSGVVGSDDDTSEAPFSVSTSKVRPSLAERTIETLSRLPSSPSVKGKGAASFYDTAATAPRPSSRPSSRDSRPGSSHQSDGSSERSRGCSRPSSTSGLDETISNFRSQIGAYNSLSTIESKPLRNRRSIHSFQTPAKTTPARPARASMYGTQTPNSIPLPRSRTPSPGKRAHDLAVPKSASRTMGARPTKKPSVNGLFKKPSVSALGKMASTETPRKASTASQRSATSQEGTNPSSASVASASTATSADSGEPGQAYRKTSAALREQIAKARAAKRAAASQQDSSNSISVSEEPSLIPTDNTFDFGLSNDPFNQHRDDKAQVKVLQSRLESARTSGRLNIAAMGLREIPAEVLNMYTLESIGKPGAAWAECVDLTRFVAADNELEMISDSVFPDVDPQELAEDEDSQGNIFAGLETLDLHGNMLVSLPMGLRRLSLLTSLNLSLNRLANNSLEVLCQITSLKDLKMGGNLLYGPLDPCFCNLENLEILDLHGNNISSLPSNFGNLSRLRILNVSENSLEDLPFEILAGMPLKELVARKNQLRGTLIRDSVGSLPTLQTLDISSNQLVHICSPETSITMPALHQLCVSMNRLQALPNISGWTSLLTLVADENNINAIPEGFTTLGQLRSVDFSSNDIRVVPAEIGRMDNLAMLRLSGNPLREKKFSSIDTDEMKSILAQRLQPPPEDVQQESEPAMPALSTPDVQVTSAQGSTTSVEDAPVSHNVKSQDEQEDSRSELDDFATPPTSAPGSPARSRSQTLSGQMWPVKSGGVLDRSNTQSSSLHPVISSKLATTHKIYEVQLHHNLFTALPESLTFFAETLTALSLAYNQLIGETYLGGASGSETLDLPALKELNLAHNHITSLGPLITHLRAPNLEKLDVSFNRVAALPAGTQLRDAFTNLTVLLISNNHLVDLDPESIKGLKVVDAGNNDIAHLNPRIGLLGGVLERLDVSGNRFRVPRWNVLERGTEATLRWLRGRVPVAEMGAWKGDGDDGDLEDLD
ncbi:Leucine-rich repeat-containing protein 40 [Madurella fahalii]|uniref:Leucine-rich repeat-containing protein 40 n=1 Tax=Madurella fahalii TaxID=1157608 RepID=A0ABQ0GED8_9PEZI